MRSRLPLSIFEFSNANLRGKTVEKANGIVGKPAGKLREGSERERERERTITGIRRPYRGFVRFTPPILVVREVKKEREKERMGGKEERATIPESAV